MTSPFVCRRTFALAACALLVATATTAGPAPAMPHVRTASSRLLALLREGYVRSATFRALFDGVEHSDLIVYVEPTMTAPRGVDAWLQYEGTSPVNRILRIFVHVPASADTIVMLVGHELQHATEVAAAPEVRDQISLDGFYRRVGDWSGTGWDSAAARLVSVIVRRELLARPSPAAATVRVRFPR